MKQIFTLIFLFIITISFSQEGIQIQGKIVDEKDSIGIAYASISIKNNHLGTITNGDGVFQFSIDEKYKNDTIIISHLSYKRIKIAIKDIDNNNDRFFYLKKKTNNLSEVVISIDSTYIILNEAYLATKKATALPTILNTYYKETVLKNDKYVLFADALLDVYINDKKVIQHRINQSRILRDTNVIINLNPVFITSLTNVYNAISKRKKGESVTHNDRLEEDINGKYYIISSTPVKTNTEISSLFNTSIYIDKKTMLIIRVEAKIAAEFIPKIREQKRDDYSAKFKSIEQVFNYNIIDNELYLEYSMIKAEINKCHESYTDKFTYFSEMYLLDVPDVKAKKFKRRDLFKGNYIYQSEGNHDYEFWNNRNIIKPTKKEQEFIDGQ